MERFTDQIYTTSSYRKALFDKLPIPVTIVSKDGYWLDVNEKALEAFKYTRSELLALKFENVTAGTDVNSDWEEANKVIKGEIDGYFMHKTYLTKTNEPFWALLIVQGIYSDEGDFQHFVSIFLPIKGFWPNLRQLGKSLKHTKRIIATLLFLFFFIVYKIGLITWDEFSKILKALL